MSGTTLFFVFLTVIPVIAQSDVAVLTGSVQDSSGTGIPNTIALLSSIPVPALRYVTHTDEAGVYRFSVPHPGAYTLELQAPGFHTVRVKHIELSSGQVNRMALETLQALPNLACSHAVFPSDIRLLPSGGHIGALVGRVRFYRPTDVGPDKISRADLVLLRHMQVTLLNADSEVLGRINTKADGAFQFPDLPPGAYTIQFKGAGLYDESWTVTVPDNAQVEYHFSLQPCPNGNCDPALRPTGPIMICE